MLPVQVHRAQITRDTIITGLILYFVGVSYEIVHFCLEEETWELLVALEVDMLEWAWSKSSFWWWWWLWREATVPAAGGPLSPSSTALILERGWADVGCNTGVEEAVMSEEVLEWKEVDLWSWVPPPSRKSFRSLHFERGRRVWSISEPFSPLSEAQFRVVTTKETSCGSESPI